MTTDSFEPTGKDGSRRCPSRGLISFCALCLLLACAPRLTADEAVFRQAAASSQEALREGLDSLKPVTVEVSESESKGEKRGWANSEIAVMAEPTQGAFVGREDITFEVYDAQEVRASFAAAQSELLERFGTEEMAGMRSYVVSFFPTPSLQTVTFEGQTFVTRGSTVQAQAQVEAFLGKLAVLQNLAVDLHVGSLPSEASFRIEPAGGGRGRSTMTDSALENLYRGYYRYTVEKAGFKTIQENLDLVDQNGGKLRCKLFPADGAEGPLPCALKP
jgi:hypothetical protein